MDDFFKQFRDNIENRPEPSFEEGDWRKLENRLAEQGQRRPAALAWWWAVPLLLLLAGANAFMLLEQRKVNRKIYALESIRDTVYQTRVIYLADTIYQTRVVKEKAPAFPHWGFSSFYLPFGSPGAVPGLVPLFPEGLPAEGLMLSASALLHSPFVEQRHQEGGQALAAPPEEAPTAGGRYYASLLEPLSPAGLHQLPDPAGGIAEIPLEPALSKRKRPLLYYLYPLRPKGLQLGLHAGGVLPVGHKMNPVSGFSGSMEVAVEFSPNLRMWADASYFNILLETDEMDEAMGVPVIMPPSDDLAFVKAEVIMPSFQFSAGMQYLLLAGNKLSPFVGLGYAAVSLLPHDVVYDFKNPDNETEWNLDMRVQNSRWYSGFVLFNAGAEYQFSEHCSARMGAGYRAYWNNTSLLSPRMFSLRGGVLYSF